MFCKMYDVDDGGSYVVQPNDDLAFAVTIPQDDQQRHHDDFGDRAKKWKNNFYADELPERWKHIVGD